MNTFFRNSDYVFNWINSGLLKIVQHNLSNPKQLSIVFLANGCFILKNSSVVVGDAQLSSHLGGIATLYMVQKNPCNLCSHHQQNSSNLYIFFFFLFILFFKNGFSTTKDY